MLTNFDEYSANCSFEFQLVIKSIPYTRNDKDVLKITTRSYCLWFNVSIDKNKIHVYIKLLTTLYKF